MSASQKHDFGFLRHPYEIAPRGGDGRAVIRNEMRSRLALLIRGCVGAFRRGQDAEARTCLAHLCILALRVAKIGRSGQWPDRQRRHDCNNVVIAFFDCWWTKRPNLIVLSCGRFASVSLGRKLRAGAPVRTRFSFQDARGRVRSCMLCYERPRALHNR